MGYRDYSTAKGRIVDATGHGDFSTISAAISAASSGDVIFVRPGTYTEDLTMKAAIEIVAFEFGFVNLVGNVTMNATGSSNIVGINLSPNGSQVITMSGSNSAVLTFYDCSITANGATGISLTNANAVLDFKKCIIGISSNDKLFDQTGGLLNFAYTSIGGAIGVTTVANTSSGGNITAEYCNIQQPITTSGTAGCRILNCNFGQSTSFNLTWLTIGGSGALNIVSNSSFFSGTASCMSIGATFAVTHCSLNSSNTNVLTGAGTLQFALISFTGSSSGHNVTTETPLATLI